ncbi:MAG: glycosyltransferase, partial [Clostridia bacterium]|nr:glycosyltransferase [Clostridia bacterium]
MAFEDGLSIIIPAYNAEKFIGDCISSACATNFPKLEVIVVNDGSSDTTLLTVQNFLQNYQGNAKITIVSQENVGVSESRNRAIEIASNPWITFLDADDFLRPNLYESIKNLPEDGEVYLFTTIVGNKRDVSPLTNKNDNFIPKEVSPTLSIRLMEYTIGFAEKNDFKQFALSCVCGAIYKRSFIKSNDIHFIKGVKNGEDLLFRLKIFSLYKKAYAIESPIYLYYMNQESVTHQFKSEIQETNKLFLFNLKKLVENKKELYKSYNRSVVNSFFLEMDHWLFHEKNKLGIKERVRLFFEIANSDLYQNAFKQKDDYWKKFKLKHVIIFLLKSKKFKTVCYFYTL